MTHTASHIIITAITTPVKEGGKVKVWHYIAAACIVCYVVGYLVGKY